MKKAFALVLPAAFLTASAAPHAQRVIRESIPVGQAFFPAEHGYSVARAGDLDGDGFEEYWMAGPGITSPSNGGGFILLCSGADGSASVFAEGSEDEQDLGVCLAGGADLSGDGVPDLLAGSPSIPFATSDPGSVKAFSGADGSLLYSVPGNAFGQRFGEALALLGDLNGDGVLDFAVGAPGDDLGGTDRGSIRVYSGADGAALATRFGPTSGSEFGTSLANVGDVDGDGLDDLLVGAPRGALTIPDSGLAMLLSGASGSTLRTLAGTLQGSRFGQAVGATRDLNGDSLPDLLVGAPGDSRAFAFSGADGALIWSVRRQRFEPVNWWFDPEPGSFGWALCGIGDQDGDGIDDVAVGYPKYSGVWMFSGVDGGLLGVSVSSFVDQTPANTISSFLGWSLARLSDLNGDGRDEILAGAPLDDFRVGEGFAIPIGSSDVLTTKYSAELVLNGDEGFMGSCVARAGDVDGDGLQDMAVAASTTGPGPNQGLVLIVSGLDRTLIRSYPVAPTPHPEAIACAGDVDDDGVEDLAIATGSAVFVFSGASGAMLPGFAGETAANVAAIGDVDGDGHDDLALGIGGLHPAMGNSCGNTFPGHVRVLSGVNGALLFQLDGAVREVFECPAVGENLGYSITGVGDWNDDGTPDIAVGVPGAGPFRGGAVRVFSGVDGALLQEFLGQGGVVEFGISVSGGPDFDFDADGFEDLVVGEQLIGYGPHGSHGDAYVFSGRDGSILFTGGAASVEVGYGRFAGPAYAVAALADYDLDGFSDLAVGNPMAFSALGPGAGEVLVVSGKDGAVVKRVRGSSSWDYLGYSLTSLGDVDGNGSTDLLIGAPASEIPAAYGHAVLVRRGAPRAFQPGSIPEEASAVVPR